MCGVCRWPLPSFPQASGDRSKLILIWEAQSCQHLYTFTGHRDAVSVRLWVLTTCLAWTPAGCALLGPGARPQAHLQRPVGSEWCVCKGRECVEEMGSDGGRPGSAGTTEGLRGM